MSKKFLDYDGLEYLWDKIKAAFVSDVKVAGTSVVSDGEANIPKTTFNKFGVVKVVPPTDPSHLYAGIEGQNVDIEVPVLNPSGVIARTQMPDASTSSKGAMSAEDKTKLDGIESGAQVNIMNAADKTKLDGIATGAEVNVQSDWNQTDSTADDYIKNKPSVVEEVTVAGTSVVSSGTASIPKADADTFGVVEITPPTNENKYLRIVGDDINETMPTLGSNGQVDTKYLPKGGYSVYGTVKAYDVTEPPAGVVAIENNIKTIYAPLTYYDENDGFQPIRTRFLPDMVGATTSQAGTKGAVPAPPQMNNSADVKALANDGTWKLIIPVFRQPSTGSQEGNVTLSVGGVERYIPVATTSNDGAMSAEDKTKLNGIIEGADVKSDGAYPDLYAGNIVTESGDTETSPYLLRKSGGGLQYDFSQEIDKLIGGTVAWNQLAPTLDSWYANNSTKNYDSTTNVLTITPASYTVNNAGAYGIYALKIGHKTLVSVEVNPTNNVGVRIGASADANVVKPADGGKWNRIQAVIVPDSTTLIVYGRIGSAEWQSGTMQIRNVISTDLTQAFGTEIADYVYSLEQTTEGSGIAWLKSHGFLTKDYYAYNEGSLLSVKTSEHRMVGTNLLPTFSSTTTNGVTFTANSDGTVTANGTASADAQAVVIIPTNLTGDFYFTGCPSGGSSGKYDVYMWDVTINARCKKWDGITNVSSDYGGTHQQVKLVGHTVMFTLRVTAGQTANNLVFKPMLVRSDVTDFTYEPYHINSYPLDSDLELRGIPKLSNGSLYYDGDVYESSGAVTRKYGYRAYQSGDESLADAITDGTNTVYKLTTPTTEQADPYASPQLVNPLGTEEYVDTRDVPVPVGHETFYPVDLKSKLESAPNSPYADGLYLLKRSGGKNTYTMLVNTPELPSAPSADGTYSLKCTVSNGASSLSWESEA